MRRIFVAIRPEEFDMLFDASSRARLQELGEVVHAAPGMQSVLPQGLRDEYDVVLTSWSTRPDEAELTGGSRLGLLVHAAGSVRGVVTRSSIESGLRVAQGGAAAMAPAVADLAVALSFALLRNLHTHDRGIRRNGDWIEGGNGLQGHSFSAQRVGVLGLSRVGRHFVRMVQGLGVREVRVFDPYLTAEAAADLGVIKVELDELFSSSTLISVHAPFTPETDGLVGAAQLALLPEGAVVVNTARSSIIQEPALLDALRAGRISAGLDVFDVEPLPADSPFTRLPNVIATPHVAGGTIEARADQGAIAVSEIERFFAGDDLENEVVAEMYDRLA